MVQTARKRGKDNLTQEYVVGGHVMRPKSFQMSMSMALILVPIKHLERSTNILPINPICFR